VTRKIPVLAKVPAVLFREVVLLLLKTCFILDKINSKF
jgi:hypothetical protein